MFDGLREPRPGAVIPAEAVCFRGRRRCLVSRTNTNPSLPPREGIGAVVRPASRAVLAPRSAAPRDQARRYCGRGLPVASVAAWISSSATRRGPPPAQMAWNCSRSVRAMARRHAPRPSRALEVTRDMIRPLSSSRLRWPRSTHESRTSVGGRFRRGSPSGTLHDGRPPRESSVDWMAALEEKEEIGWPCGDGGRRAGERGLADLELALSRGRGPAKPSARRSSGRRRASSHRCLELAALEDQRGGARRWRAWR